MKKVAIFVEGHGEQIFIRHLIQHLIFPHSFSYECLCLQGKTLINVQGDTRVLSYIKKREQGLFDAGFQKIIGLRDMFSQEYRKDLQARGMINPDLIQQFIEGAHKSIALMSQPNNIHFHFAIMELEAWWFCIYPLFYHYDKRFTVDLIKEILGEDVSQIDPEKTFFHPAKKVEKLFESVEKRYTKKREQVEKMMACLKIEDLNDILKKDDKRCASFKQFCRDLMEY